MNNDTILNSIWVEKYRPKDLDDLILPEDYMNDFKSMIEKGEINNLLFHGPPGGGKSTLARIITSHPNIVKLKKANLLEINGSSKKGRSINMVDKVIEPFLSSPPIMGDKYKIVFIDEFDNLTPESFKSLRGVIEKFQIQYGRFITTGNDFNNIPDFMQSRFTEYRFKPVTKSFVSNYCEEILNNEKIEYDKKNILKLVETFYPDIRTIINVLQKETHGGKLRLNKESLIINETVIISSVIEIINALINNLSYSKNMNNILNILNNENIDYRKIYNELFFNNKIPPNAKIIINEYSMSHKGALVSEMNFMAMIFKIIKSIKEYNKLIS